MSLLKVENLSISYGAIEAVKDISFEVNEGEVVTLIGANGAGKTSTLRAISGLEKVSSGKIIYNNQEIQKFPARKIVAEGLSQVPEGRHVFPGMTVLENLEMGAFLSTDKDKNLLNLKKVFSRFPRLEERKNQDAATLSGGEQQRIVLARAILKDAPIVVLDEATAFADPENEQLIRKALAHLTQGKTVLMIAHRLTTVQDADSIVVVNDGEIVEQGTHEELLSEEKYYHRMWNEYQQSVSWKL